MGSALHVFQPDGDAPDDGGMSPVLGNSLSDGIRAYLDHMTVAVEAGLCSKAAYKNHVLYLSRFESAWCVRFDRRGNFIIPQTEPKRAKRFALEYSAESSQEAVAAARRLAAKLGTNVGLSVATVCRNGDRAISDAGNDDLIRWTLANTQWKSGHAKVNNQRSIMSCFKWFDDENGVKCPFKRRRMPRYRCERRRPAEDWEYIALMRSKTPRALRRVLWCLYNVDGIRPGEVRGMQWKDFDWDRCIVQTYEHKTARQTGKARKFLLTPRRRRFFLALYRQRREGQTHVFLNCRGRKPWTCRALADRIRQTARAIGLDTMADKPVTAYCFRHAYSTQARKAQVPEENTVLLGGWETPDMLRATYDHSDEDVSHLHAIASQTETKRRESRHAQGIKPRPNETR